MGEEISNTEEISLDSSVSYINEINRIKKSSQPAEVKLDLLNLLIKDFMRKNYHTKKNAEYSELIEHFLERKRPNLATFCHEMVEELYGGEEINEGRIQLILDDAKNMFMKEFDIKEKPEKQNIKRILNPFANIRKPQSPLIDSEHVSKGTKKVIEKFLVTQGEPIKDPPQEGQVSDNMQQEEEISSLKVKLNLSNKDKIDSPTSQDNPEKIQNIDDMERIKEKIRLKKMSIYQDK